jgi:hypothetical protein
MNSQRPVGVLRHGAFGALLVAAVIATSGCASVPTSSETTTRVSLHPSTGRVIFADDLQRMLPGLVVGNRLYAEVDSGWLRQWYARYRAELHHLGIVRWDMRFDCNRFAAFYSGMAQAFFYSDAFHSRTPAQALALGPFWYRRDDDGGGHAIIQAVTERGRIFIDPQSGVEVKLTGVELASAYLQFF